MNFLWFGLIGVLSGIFAGMGMGGGTFLIPLLTIIMGVEQHIAQGVNLVVFVPIAIIVLIIYSKKKMLKFADIFWLIVPAVIVGSVGSILAIKIGGKILQMIFGIFLVIIGLIMITTTIISQVKNAKSKK